METPLIGEQNQEFKLIFLLVFWICFECYKLNSLYFIVQVLFVQIAWSLRHQAQNERPTLYVFHVEIVQFCVGPVGEIGW